jgi:hypothetical protein
MNNLQCIDVKRVRGNKDAITSIEVITGLVEYIAMQDGTALIMLPIEAFVAENEKRRHAGILEIKPLDKNDIHFRGILSLTKKEYLRVLSAKSGEVITITRKGWGQTFNHKFTKV